MKTASAVVIGTAKTRPIEPMRVRIISSAMGSMLMTLMKDSEWSRKSKSSGRAAPA